MEALLGADDFVEFESRNRVFNEILETLRDENVSLIGICGMGGIGKTKLVMEIGKTAKNEGIFDEVVMTMASQDPDIRRMQGILADMLRLEFKGTSEADRAADISERLKKERRVLIILDDVWEKLNLADIGMPSTLDHKCCKLILTTRRAQVCDDMCCQRMFHLNALDDSEALYLFSKHARITPYGNPQHHSKAKKVVKECGGLPLAIETVGSALRKKSLPDYDDAIRKLSHSAYADIESVDREIYPAIKLSVDYLNCKETVGCLTLFSLYPEDSRINLEDFTRIAFGVGLFENVNSIEEARQNALRCVIRLLDACLLLPSQGTLESWKSFQQIYETWNNALVSDYGDIPSVKVHDIVRDVALWLSRKDKFFYMQKSPSNKQSKEYEDAIAISMKDCGLDGRLKCPKLKLLLVETDISGLQDGCFKTMSALQVLEVDIVDESDMDIFAERALLASMQHLHDLRTFLFRSFDTRWCPGKHLSGIGMLKNLQILRLNSGHIMELPQEMEELSSLKLLDLSGCWNLEKIPRNVLSSLTALEELYFGYCNVEVKKDVFLEITSLPHLTALTARVNFAGSLPTVSFRKPLRRYAINSEDTWEWDEFWSRIVILDDVDCSEMASLQQLFPQVEDLYIRRLRGTWENLFPGCSEDPLLKIDACDVDCLVDTTRTCHVRPTPLFSNLQRLVLADMSNMTRLCNSPSPPVWVPNLIEAEIGHYHGSQNIVPHIIPIGSKLQVLQVEECLRLKHIFEFDPQHLRHVTNEMSLLPSPTELSLANLHELTAIWKWPHQTETLDLTKYDSHDEFCNLISEAMFRSLNSLARLKIWRCEKLEEVFQLTDCNDQKYKEQLSNLTTVHLFGLRQLRCIWKGPQQNLHLRKLECIELHDCSKLTSILSPASATSLRKLRSIKICKCEALESIISPEEDELSTSAASSLTGVSINIPELETIDISLCLKLKSILPVSILAQGLPQLGRISIAHCAELEQVFSDREGTLTNRDEIALNSLVDLKLVNLPSLAHFSTPKGHLICPSLKVLTVACCPLLVKSFRIGQALDGYVHGKDQVQCQNLNNEVVEGQLMEYCQDIIWTSPLRNFVALRSVELTDIHEAKEIFDFSGTIIDQPMCSRLEILGLQSLTALNHIWRGPIRSVQLLYLRDLRIYECPNLRTLFTSTIIAGSLKKLEKIEMGNCINLETILVMGELDFSEVPFFPALSKINIKGCNKLKSVLPLSVARELPQLQSLEIENCPVLQHVFSADEGEHTDYGNLHDIKLPNLRSLMLAKVPSSMLFTSANLLVSCPKLGHLFFEGMEETEPTHLVLRFLLTAVAEPSTLKGMDGSDINDVCQRLADIRLMEPRVALNELPVLKCLWEEPTNFIRMTCLSHIEVGNCVGLKTLFTQSIALTLRFLETIAIYNCQELEYIIEPSDHHVEGEEESFSTVTYLERLRKISIERCKRLKFIFPLSVAQRLPSLTEMSVKGARQLEQLFSDDERRGCAEDKDKDIERAKLMERVSVSTGLPKLRVIEVQECERLASIFPLSAARHLEQLWIHDCPNLRTLFTSTIIAGSLKKLQWIEIGNCINLETILVMGELDFSEVPFYPALSKINIKGCNKLKSVLPLSVAQELPQLESLEIENCPVLQHVFSADEGEHTDYGNLHDIKLPKLWSLKLAKVPSSMLFTSANLLVSCPNLRDLFFEGVEASEPTHLTLRFLHTGVAEPSTLKGMDTSDINDVCQRLADIRLIKPPRVVLNGLPVLKCLWKDPTNFIRMTCLSHIEVGNCVGLKTLFSQSIAQTLCFLETIVICNCQELEYFIEPSDPHVEGEEESFSTVTYLERLREIRVEGCERLKFIFPLSIAQRLPSLMEMSVKGARQLEQLFSDDERRGCAEDNYKDIELPKLRTLKLEHLFFLPRMIPAGYVISSSCLSNLCVVSIRSCGIEDACSVYQLPCLTHLDIIECPNLRTLFRSTVARALKTLKQIKIKSCQSLDTILAQGEGHFVDEFDLNEPACFSTLWQIEIEGCHKLKSVIPFSAAQKFKKLKKIEIKNCQNLEAILAMGEGHSTDEFEFLKPTWLGTLQETKTEECHELKSVLPELRILRLEDLPCLSRIFPSSYGLSRLLVAKLQALFVKNCNIEEVFNLSEGLNSSSHQPKVLNLKELYLLSLPNLKHIWTVSVNPKREQGSHSSRASVSTGLPKLRVIEVQECERLTSIFPLSVARQLPSLKKMSVKRVHQLEQLFRDNEREGCAEGKEIEVPELRTLELEDLPCLSHMLPAGYVISSLSFSKLRAVFIKDCGIEEVFDCTLECGGLYRGPVFANLTVLYLCCLPNLISIWKATYPCAFMGFNQLKFLHVEGCEQLTTIFPKDQYFPNLETVHVEGAVNLQTVFDSHFPQWTIWLRVPQLKTAQLSHLPSGVLSNRQSAHVSDAYASYIENAADNNLFDLDDQADVDVHAALEAYHQVKRSESDDLHRRQHLPLVEQKAQ